MIRITGGKWKGRALKTPTGLKVRPTRSMVREAIFNMVSVKILNARVLDLFAGSGLLGLEAISRGAREAVFVERVKSNCKVLKNNILSLDAARETVLLCQNTFRAITLLKRQKKVFDIALIDPPYELSALPVLNTLSSAGIMTSDSWLIIERGKDPIATVPETMRRVRQKKYGDTTIHIFQNIR